MKEPKKSSPTKDSTNNNTESQNSTTKIYPSIEKERLKKAYNLAMIGFLSIVAMTIFLIIYAKGGTDASDNIVAIVQPFLTLLGTLVGTFFGIQIGSSGKEELAEQAKDANEKLTLFAASLDPDKLNSVISAYKEMKK